MYDEWLQGASLRTLARRYNIGRMTLHKTFRRHYGDNATNPRCQGLARVVRQEYNDPATAAACRGIEGAFKTGREEANHSRLKHLPLVPELVDMYYHQETPEPEPETGLNLYIFGWLFGLTAAILKATFMEAGQDYAAKYANPSADIV